VCSSRNAQLKLYPQQVASAALATGTIAVRAVETYADVAIEIIAVGAAAIYSLSHREL